MSLDKKPITKGHRYFFGIHMGIARHVDVLKEIRVGGRTAWKGAKSGQARWKITAATLFGGDDGEGGIYGTIDMMTGAADQPVNRRLRGMLGGLVPAFRGACTLFYDGLVTSMSPYPKPWEVRGARTTGDWDGGTWYPEKVTIPLGPIQAMNPAHILYEAITNREWGRGKDRAFIDDVQWRGEADALYAEGFGLCLAWKQADKISSFIQSILDHIGAAVVLNRRTAKLQLLLIRDNYVVADLPLFDEDSGLLSIEDDENAASAPAANEIIVTFTNPEAYGAQQQVRVQNSAAIASVGTAITETLEFLHLPTAALALRVAQRVLREKSVSKRLKVTLDRRGSVLQPGTPFRIRSLKRGIAEMVLRAGKVEDGTLASGSITVTAMQDAFGLPATSFVEVQPPDWVPPATSPLPATVRKPFELSYRDLVVGLSAADLAALHPTACAFGIMIRRPTNASINYVLLTKAGGVDYNAAGSGDFCPSAQIINAIGHLDTAVQFTFVTDIEGFTPGQVGVIDDETVQLVSVDWMTGNAVIKRGCGDTVPVPHVAGARVWFYADSSAVDPVEYATGVTVSAKVLPYTFSGWLDAALAPVDTLLMKQRQYRPYPPGNLRINGAAYPAEVTGEVTVSIAHRDRVLQADQLVDTTAASIGPESGAVARIRFYSGAVLKRTVTLPSATSYTYALGDELADGGPFNPLRIVVDAQRDGLDSQQAHDISVGRLGLVAAPPIRLDVTVSSFGADATTHLVAMPATVAAGDLLLMHFVNDGNATVSTPAGWSLLNSSLQGSAVRSTWFFMIAAGTEASTTVNALTSAAEHGAAQVHRIQAGTFDVAVAPAIAVASGSGTSPNPPLLTPAWGAADTLWLTAYGADDDDATTVWPWTAGQNYTPSGTGTTSCSAASCELALNVASIDPGVFTMASTEEWVAATLAIKPAP